MGEFIIVSEFKAETQACFRAQTKIEPFRAGNQNIRFGIFGSERIIYPATLRFSAGGELS